MRSMIGSATGRPSLESSPVASAAMPPHAAGARCFSKHFTEEWLFRATLRNSLRAWAAARRASWLRVPEVLHADHRALRIDYEYLDGWNPLHTVLRNRTFGGLPAEELRRTFWSIGAALEEFHRYTHRIHGDFDFDNILVKAGSHQAVFVDFTPPEYTRFRHYNEADPYWDIAIFILFVRAKYPPYQLHLALRPQLRELARAFIEGYFRDTPASYDQRTLEHYMNEVLERTYLGQMFNARYLRRSRLFRTDDLAPGV
jgi:tRNA A-37 threonylcarbamoyl transferase component Bud32